MKHKLEDILVYDKMTSNTENFTYVLSEDIKDPVVWGVFPIAGIQQLQHQPDQPHTKPGEFCIIPPRLPPDSDKVAIITQLLLHILPRLLESKASKFIFTEPSEYSSDADFLYKVAVESCYRHGSMDLSEIILGKQYLQHLPEAHQLLTKRLSDSPNYNLERRSHFIDGIPDGVALFLPESERLGCWAVFPDDTKGIFMIENEIQVAKFTKASIP